jgi:hypothetical protein
MKAVQQDTLARGEQVLCFEMDAAGLDGPFPVRGHPGHLRLFRLPQERYMAGYAAAAVARLSSWKSKK